MFSGRYVVMNHGVLLNMCGRGYIHLRFLWTIFSKLRLSVRHYTLEYVSQPPQDEIGYAVKSNVKENVISAWLLRFRFTDTSKKQSCCFCCNKNLTSWFSFSLITGIFLFFLPQRTRKASSVVNTYHFRTLLLKTVASIISYSFTIFPRDKLFKFTWNCKIMHV